MTTYCAGCGAEGLSTQTFCMACGARLIESASIKPKTRYRWWLYCFAVLVFWMVLIFGWAGPKFLSKPTGWLDKASAQSPSANSPSLIEEQVRAGKQLRADAVGTLSPKAMAICIRHPNWDPYECTSIAHRQIWIGMTEEQARASWGAPEEINRDIGAASERDQWVYGHDYLYFSGGRMTYMQTSRTK
jgi:hypothetical protein